MKIEKIKSNIKKLLIIWGSVVSVLVAGFVVLFLYNDTLQEDSQNIKNRVSSLRSEVDQKNRFYAGAKGNLDKFLKIPISKLPTNSGHKESYQRIKEILPRIEKFKDLYSFKRLTFTLGKIEENRDYSMNGEQAYSGSVSLYFEGVSDEFVFSFMEDLENALPGYLQLEDFYISKKSDLNNDNVKMFLTSRNFYFVAGKIDFNWITFKQKEEK